MTDYSMAEVAAMHRAVARLFGLWQVSPEAALEILGREPTPEVLAALLGIHVSLRTVFSEPHVGYRWMSAPNAAFGGDSALNVLRRGDIETVQRYLLAIREGT